MASKEKSASVTGRDVWKESVRFRFEDWGWVVINIGMGIGAGIAISRFR